MLPTVNFPGSSSSGILHASVCLRMNSTAMSVRPKFAILVTAWPSGFKCLFAINVPFLVKNANIYFMKSQHQSIKDLPKNPGIYKFISKDGVVLYVGKATELRSRVKSYFSKDLINTRGPAILDMVTQAEKVDYVKTDTDIETLILEDELIKKLQPKYNVKEKDDKSFLCVVITDEELPKVLTVRKKDIDLKNKNAKILRGKKIVKVDAWYGPFTNGQSLKIALRIIRRIFPYIDIDSIKKDNIEFYKQLNLTPNESSIYINDIALIREDISQMHSSASFRIEAYDIAHMSGKNMVGVMVVLNNNQADKGEYKKFNIKTVGGANDPEALREVLERRVKHSEWQMPSLVVVDGNKVQIKVAEKVFKQSGMNVPVVSVVKDDRHKAREIILGDDSISLSPQIKKAIFLANSEAHRFAIGFHKQKRSKK